MVGAVGLEPTCIFRSWSQTRRSTFDPHSERPQGFASGQPARSTMTVELDPTWLIGFGCGYRDRTGLFERMKLVRTPCLPPAINQLQYNFQRIESLASLQSRVSILNLISDRSWFDSSHTLLHSEDAPIIRITTNTLPRTPGLFRHCLIRAGWIYLFTTNQMTVSPLLHRQLTHLFPGSITAIARDSGHHTLRNTLLLHI